jgi:hypothetical protein
VVLVLVLVQHCHALTVSTVQSTLDRVVILELSLLIKLSVIEWYPPLVCRISTTVGVVPKPTGGTEAYVECVYVELVPEATYVCSLSSCRSQQGDCIRKLQ